MKRFNPVMTPAAYTWEVILPSSLQVGQEVPFGDIPYLRDKKIIGVSLVDGTTTSISPTSNNVATSIEDSYVTLVDNQSFQFLEDVPSADLAAVKYYRPPYMFAPRIVKFEQSFITMADNAQAGRSYVFTFFYEPTK